VAEGFSWTPGDAPPPIGPHSAAKLRVLRRYLHAYFDTYATRPAMDALGITLVDGFCGGGTFSDGGLVVPGSPLIMLEEVEAARKRLNQGRAKPLAINARFRFVDIERPHLDHLRRELIRHGHLGPEVELIPSAFEEALPGILREIQARQRRGRSIFLLDQCGYTDVALEQVRRIFAALPAAEVILTFAADALVNFLRSRRSFVRSLAPLGRVDEPEPEAGGDEMDEGEEALGRLVVPCGHGPELLQLVDEPLDPVAEPVQRAVERGGLLAHRVRGDDRQDPSHQQLPPDPVGVVARVADQAADARRHVLEQGPERAGLVRLPGREDDGQGQAAGVAAEVQLGREPAARSAQGLTVPPPFAPAACWWARIVVPSSICSRSSAAPLPARAWNTASNTPRSRQRAKRRQTVFRLPYRSGMVRQRAPSRARHRMPSRRRRFSRPGRPRSVDSSGPTSPHSASVRSPEATPSSRYRKGGRTLDTPVPVPFVHTA
jgi:three-Cys-motif partner protein